MSASILYRAYGLSVSSCWPILGAMAVARDELASEPPNVEILEGEATLSEPFDLQARPPQALVHEQRGIARFLSDRGRRIVVSPYASSGRDTLLAALIATALPVALWLRGEWVLHAGAVLLPGADRAIAIAGPSGSGKSTILGQLVSQGAALLADDTLCPRIVDDSIVVSGLPGSLFVRPDSTSADYERRIRHVPARQRLPSARLGVLLVLDLPRRAEGAAFRRLKGPEALSVLLRNRHRSWVPRLLGSEGAMWPITVQLLERVMVYAWARQEGAPGLDTREFSFLHRAGLDGITAGHID